MKKVFIFLFLSVMVGFWLSNSFCLAGGNEQEEKHFFDSANNFYANEEYDLAIKEYTKIIEAGREGGNIYYNLGNCYFKKGELGRAILNYQRAMKLIPRDGDLKANYKYAQSLIEGDIIIAKKIWPLKLFYVFSGQFTLNEVIVFTSSLYFLIVVFIIMGIVFKLNKKQFGFILLGLIMCLAATLLLFFNKAALLGREGVVISESVEAKFEPSDDTTTHFTLYEGTNVFVVSSKNEWRKIRRLDGKTGWVKSSILEMI